MSNSRLLSPYAPELLNFSDEYLEENRLGECAECDGHFLRTFQQSGVAKPKRCKNCKFLEKNQWFSTEVLVDEEDLLSPLTSSPDSPSMRSLLKKGKSLKLPPHIYRSKQKANNALRNIFEASIRSQPKKSDSTSSIIEPKKPRKRERPKGSCRTFLSSLLTDWVLLALLGCSMALCSIAMDEAIDRIANWHISVLHDVEDRTMGMAREISTFAIWVLYAVVLVTSSALFAHYVAPQAIGSGIPEMKTILRGVVLKEYLSFRTLASKMVGLTLSLGSGMPIGKEGPFVHVASVVANLLSRLVHSFDSVYVNESRHTEMLAAGCAVGVACVFSAPVGGVLFSIEVTSVYFAVRNYWRGFFAAACAATVFRLAKVFISLDDGLIAFYQTSFPADAFYPEEMIIFAAVGFVCGVASAGFIALHRFIVLFLRRNNLMKKIFQRNWLIYPIVVSIFISTLTYPKGYGLFIGGYHKFSKAAQFFFLNCTWTAHPNSSVGCGHELDGWLGEDHDRDVFLVLSCFMLTFYILAALASTLPIPSGSFGPSFTIGAVFGRFVGEVLAVWKPNGFRGNPLNPIYPGGYAVVGAAAFSGGVTQTISVAVIMFEITGQLVHILPVMIAVLIANAVCSYLQPSIYDSIIQIKHLPYLPDIPHASSRFHGVHVEQFMTSNIQFLSKDSTYSDVQEIILSNERIKAFPIVENKENMILIGSCSKAKLVRSLNEKVGQTARQAEALRQFEGNLQDINRRFKPVHEQRGGILMDPETQKILQNSSPIEKLSPQEENYYYEDSPQVLRSQNQRLAADEAGLKASKSSPILLGQEKRHVNFENDSRKRSRFTITAVNDKSSTSSSLETDLESGSTNLRSNKSLNVSHLTHDFHSTMTDIIRSLAKFPFQKQRKPSADDYDLHGDERKRWENSQLSLPIDWNTIGVDPAPFQLVEQSSLLKVHSLFSLLGLSRAYVTKCGRLVGVVALRDIRLAVEKVNNGQLTVTTGNINTDPPQSPPRQNILQKLRSTANDTILDDEEDALNDYLNPPLVVVDQTAIEADEWEKSKPEEKQDVEGGKSPLYKGYSVGSDPCLAGSPSEDTKKPKMDRRAKSLGLGMLAEVEPDKLTKFWVESTESQESPPMIQMTSPTPPNELSEDVKSKETEERQQSSQSSHRLSPSSAALSTSLPSISDIAKAEDAKNNLDAQSQPARSSSTVTIGKKHQQIHLK
uniref:Chloride channel protein n=1 Tax=Bursaphelenchus xylophilus TaxID=6326 RepID=A0A1I7SRN0_BURXY